MSWTPYDRDKPKPFIDEAIKLFDERKGKVICEIGCMRMRLKHPVDEENHECCCDGHSSLLFARTGKEFYSVDINPKAVALTLEHVNSYRATTEVLCQDGIGFLFGFGKPIDLLFLDGWDVDLNDCAEKHVEAYKAAKHRLHDKSVVIIDDTDVEIRDHNLQPIKEGYGGKGRLLVPLMIKEGWKVHRSGRCTILIK